MASIARLYAEPAATRSEVPRAVVRVLVHQPTAALPADGHVSDGVLVWYAKLYCTRVVIAVLEHVAVLGVLAVTAGREVGLATNISELQQLLEPLDAPEHVPRVTAGVAR